MEACTWRTNGCHTQALSRRGLLARDAVVLPVQEVLIVDEVAEGRVLEGGAHRIVLRVAEHVEEAEAVRKPAEKRVADEGWCQIGIGRGELGRGRT